MTPLLYVVAFWAVVVLVVSAAVVLSRRARRRREAARRTRFVRIKIARFTCSVCDKPIEDGELAVWRFSYVSDSYYSHVKCAISEVLEDVVGSAP